ncbi:GNAT family N-acetyltransferase [Salinisphaera aquimarina]|uniref:L-ornithine N(alpha)-acyltransferase n=1 Tax=Salinisphaera aquimarina TaxID=2094031 RepID=A0ABV7ELI6_9GAMM
MRLARSAADIRASLRLRHRVFVDEMGADIACADAIETDDFDRHCQHLLVIDPVDGELLASTRLLDCDTAQRIGGFYSESEFDMAPIRHQPGRTLEIGRTCVAPQSRQGAVIAALWSGIGAFVRSGRFEHLIGCASIDARDGSARAHFLYAQLVQTQLSPVDCRVTPKRELPPADTAKDAQAPVFSRPPLLKAYLRLGATVGGAPCWDPEFRVADLFMHLQVANLCPRYARHFLHRPRPAAHRPPVTVR